MKFLEDHLFYSKIQDWQNIASYFDNILAQELEFGVAENDVKRWHFLLKEYFVNYHSFEVLEGLIAKMNFPSEVFKELKIVIELREKREVVGMIEGLYDEFNGI